MLKVLSVMAVAAIWFLVGVFSCEARGDTSIGTILASQHFGTDVKYNERQFPSLYIKRDNWSAGFYRHSYAHWVNSTRDEYAAFIGREFSLFGSRNLSGFVSYIMNYPTRDEFADDIEGARFPHHANFISVGVNYSFGPAKVHVLPLFGVAALGFETRID